MALSGLYTLISAPPAFAASQQECFDRFNNKPYEYARLSIAEQTLLNQCRSEGFCLVKSTDRDTNQITLTCSNPIISAGTATAADKEVAPLVTLVCGSPPASDTLMDNYLSCGAKVRKIYSSCDNTGGSITSNMQDSDQNTAKCVYQKLSNPKPSQAKVLAAVKQGRADATKATDEAVSNAQIDAARKACEERIKKGEKVEWKNNECVASTEGGNNSTCRVNGVGWIVCPVVNFLSGIADSAYGMVASMLTVPAVNTSDTNNALYQAWSIVRNLANICFVIAFLVIIYSQITSAGISNYGIKKLLPKLIISAVLVNVSYWICALAVDISNFLGYAISGMFATVGKSIMGEAPTTLNSGNSFTALAAGVLVAGAAVAFLQLSMLLPLLVGAVLVITVVVIILTLRQGLIVMLIVISPLAFVAYLLPNTSKLFNRWWDAFKALLLMFPVIAFVYAGSALAGKVLSGVAEDMNGGMKVGFQIMAAALPILSFITVYTLMKTSSALLGKLMDNNPARGVGDRMKRGAENRGKRYDNQRSSYALNKGGIRGALVGGRARARARSAAVDTAAEKNKQYAQQGYVAEEAQSEKMTLRSRALNKATFGKLGDTRGENFVSAMSRGGGGMARAQATAQAISTSKAQFNDAVKAEQSTMNSMNPDNLVAEMQNTSLTEARRTAAAGMVAASGSGRHIQEAIDYLGRQRSAERLDAGIAADDTVTEGPASHAQSMQQQMASQLSKYKPAMMGASKLGSLERGDYASTYEADITDRVSNGKVSGEGYVSMSPDDRTKLHSVMENYQQGVASGNIQRNQAFENGVKNLVSEVNKYASAPQNAGKVSDEIRGDLNKLAREAGVSTSSNQNPSRNPSPNQPPRPATTSAPTSTQSNSGNSSGSGSYSPPQNSVDTSGLPKAPSASNPPVLTVDHSTTPGGGSADSSGRFTPSGASADYHDRMTK